MLKLGPKKFKVGGKEAMNIIIECKNSHGMDEIGIKLKQTFKHLNI